MVEVGAGTGLNLAHYERARRVVAVEPDASMARRLRALSPRATLDRGYAIVRRGDEIVRAAGSLDEGERIDVELARGGFGARVEETRP